MTDRDKIEQEAEARVVAWLREQQARAVSGADDADPAIKPLFDAMAAAFRASAAAIARREHLPADLEGDK